MTGRGAARPMSESAMRVPSCSREKKGANAAQDPWVLQTSREWLHLIMGKQPYSESSLPTFFLLPFATQPDVVQHNSVERAGWRADACYSI